MRQEQADVRRLAGEPEPVPALPATEARGGTDPDWDRARPGEELPAKPGPELYDPPADGV
jgi:hypothetical protein